MNRLILSRLALNACLSVAASLAGAQNANMTPQRQPDLERTSFQSHAPYRREVDVRSHVAIAYGVDDTFTSRVTQWKENGYRTHMMTGAAWGQYEEYIDGRFDGKRHDDEGQCDPAGNVIWHHPGVPYMVPTPSFIAYLKSLCRKAIDSGVEAIHLEEPEFWSRAGYSEGFKRMWKTEYGEEWSRPDSSPDAFWRSSKLKYMLYKRTLEQVFADAKQYAASKGREVKCFVPTHSLVSYSQWAIVSPESALMDLDNCDGYIAQVWTGTARSPNHYAGHFAERTFETAFLEYSSVYEMVAPTQRTVYFLADPIEDDPNHTWDDYKSNYERVVAASLLFPAVDKFEVMPWPDRVLTATYPSGTYSKDEKCTIPQTYLSELMTVINALNDMKQPDYEWLSGSSEVALLASDTMMFQRHSPWNDDSSFNDFFGLALPLVKHGIAARILVLERIQEPRAFDGIKTLLMSYEHMKPMKPEYHTALAQWVKQGGILLFFGEGGDQFQKVREWWNAGDNETSTTPQMHLFKELGLDTPDTNGFTRVGRGLVRWIKQPPAEFAVGGKALSPEEAPTRLLELFESAMTRKGTERKRSNALVLRRGPYVTGGVMEETSITEPFKLKGWYADLFSAGVELDKDPVIEPGMVFLKRKITTEAVTHPVYIAGNASVETWTTTPTGLSMKLRTVSGLDQIVVRVQLPRSPQNVQARHGNCSFNWHEDSRTVLITPDNPAGESSLHIDIELCTWRP